MIQEITILPGFDRQGKPEDFREITLKAGETLSIVGATGSGKTSLITDIELLAQGDTHSRRRILINGEKPSDAIRHDPALKPIAMITQNTKCFTDLLTEEFLRIHARARGIPDQQIVRKTIDLANQLTGEKITREMKVTVLSGGQTRSLMIADAILIGAAPVILLDEIENAGIFKQEALRIVENTGRIIVFVTHDPVIALLTEKRIIMENGGVKKILCQDATELRAAKDLLELDRRMGIIREKLRSGQVITDEMLRVSFG